MTKTTLLLGWLLLGLSFLSGAEHRSGRAVAQWHTIQDQVLPGQRVDTAFRLKPDPGWHSYWVNPGEGGMKTSVEVRLPQGWQSGDLRFPLPHRFDSMGLKNIGYEEEIFIFLSLQVPADAAAGPVELGATLSWLTCDDQACVPGSVELKLSLEVGDGAARDSGDAALLRRAKQALPREVDWTVTLTELGDELRLEFRPPAGVRLSGCEVWLGQESLADLDAKPRWAESEGRFTALMKKSEYFSKLPSAVPVLLSGGGLERSVRLEVSGN